MNVTKAASNKMLLNLIPIILVGATALVGCRNTVEYGVVTQSEISWTISATNPIPGIDGASVTFITLKAGPPAGVPFVVWSDLPNGTSGRGMGGSSGASYEGYHAATDGRRVEFHAKTTDGKSGSIAIAGVDYDLAKGSLFLVSTSDDPPKVAQIAFDLSGFPKGGALQEFAKSNLQIRGFFEKHKRLKGFSSHSLNEAHKDELDFLDK